MPPLLNYETRLVIRYSCITAAIVICILHGSPTWFLLVWTLGIYLSRGTPKIPPSSPRETHQWEYLVFGIMVLIFVPALILGLVWLEATIMILIVAVELCAYLPWFRRREMPKDMAKPDAKTNGEIASN
jgi:hypothetical protein